MRRLSDVGDSSVLRDYELLAELGRGSFAVVYKAFHKVTSEYVAVKMLSKVAILQNDMLDPVMRELEIMKMADHPLVVHLFEVLEDENYIYIVMELLEGGNLLTFINEQGSLPEDNAKHIFRQLVSAMEYLHDTLKVVHRDLKAENLLFDKNNNLRIIDFGLSRRNVEDGDVCTTVCGSPAYAAPEVIRGTGYSNLVDVWSAGIILYGMVVGSLPFYDQNLSKQLQMVLTQEVEYPPTMTPMLVGLMERILERDPAQRITIEQIKLHPWFMPSALTQEIDYNGTPELRLLNFPVSQSVGERMRMLKLPMNRLQAEIYKGVASTESVAYRILKTKEVSDVMAAMLNESRKPMFVGSMPPIMAFDFEPSRDVQSTPVRVTKYTSTPERCCLSPGSPTKVRKRKSTVFNITHVPKNMASPLIGLSTPLGHVKRARALSLAPALVKPALHHSTIL